MLIDVDADDPRPVFQQIADEVRRAVAVGQLAADAPLPAVRRLADELKVNPNTVQHAYRTLERDGVVYVRRGTGTFVSPTVKEPGKERRAAVARQIAGRAMREGFRHGLLASEIIAALQEIAPRTTKSPATSPKVKR
jgi:GntR family transcriptional regulator